MIALALLMALPIVTGARSPSPGTGPKFSALPARVTPDKSCAVGSGPDFPAYDPVNRDVYVPNAGSRNISVLNGVCKVVGTIGLPTGSVPVAAAFDPANNEVFVTDYELSQVYIVHGLKLVDTVTSGTLDAPWGIAYDPGANLMAVANRGSDTVTFLTNGGSLRYITTVGTAPVQFAYDPDFDRLLVSNTGSNNVTSMNANTPNVEADDLTIPVGTAPAQIAFDYADSYDYVVDANSNNVTVIDAVGAHLGSISVGDFPRGAVWDQATLSVDVASEDSSTIAEIQGTSVVGTITGHSGSGLAGIAYDSATDQIFGIGNSNSVAYIYGTKVASAGPVASGTSCEISGGELEGVFPAYDPVNHLIYVPDISNVVAITGACKDATVIPVGASGAVITSVAFNPANNLMYAVDEANKQVYAIDGTTVVATITSSLFHFPDGVAYFPTAADPGDGDLMTVANGDASDVSFLEGTFAPPLSSPAGDGPFGMAFDPMADRLIVTNQLGENATALNPFPPSSSFANINIPTGDAPTGVDYNYADGTDYVANWFSNNVTIFEGNGLHLGSVAVGSEPQGVAWDQAALAIYVANMGSNNISVLQGNSVVRTISGPASFQGVAYDQATGQVFLTGFDSGDVYVYT